MKIAFTGKGGVGKTTLAALLIHNLAKDGHKVLAVDCDPNPNLAAVLGFEDAAVITPISKMQDLIYERMEVKDKNPLFYKLNPKIDDIPDAFAKRMGTIRLVVMGTVEKSGGGCVCPESVFLRNLLSRIIVGEGEHIVLDMEAGIEHLGRRTAEVCNYFVTVVEPSWRSIGTALKIGKLARESGAREVYAIANKVRSADDREFIAAGLGGMRIIAEVPFSNEVVSLDRGGSIGQLKGTAIEGLMNELLALT